MTEQLSFCKTCGGEIKQRRIPCPDEDNDSMFACLVLHTEDYCPTCETNKK